MAYPPLPRKLFQSEGAGPELKEEIVPHELEQEVTVPALNITDGGYIRHNDATDADGTRWLETIIETKDGENGARIILGEKSETSAKNAGAVTIHANNGTLDNAVDFCADGVTRFNNQIYVGGKSTGAGGFISQDGGENEATGDSVLYIKRAYQSNGAPNNGVILSFGNVTSWCGQLYMGDNDVQGCSWNGWSDGVRGTWKHLWMEGEWINATGFTATSDARHKRDLTPVRYDLSSITAYHYVLKDDGKPHVGLIAQEVQQIIPDAVSADKDGVLSLDYNAVVAALVEEVKDLKRRCDSLESEKVSLRAAVENLAGQKKSLERICSLLTRGQDILRNENDVAMNEIAELKKRVEKLEAKA